MNLGNEEEIIEEPVSVSVPTPRQLCMLLDKYVIGQDEAKKAISVAVFNHYKRFLTNRCNVSIRDDEPEDLKDVTIEKSNLLILGNTGTGKTYMVKILAKYLGIPCYIADSTKLTESGFVGDDVESMLSGLIRSAGGYVDKAECGICVIDEIDKLSRRGENPSITRDVGGEGVQQSLLKIVEGTKIGVPPNGGRKHPEQKLIEIDTSNILFIAMGAFDGLDKIVQRRVNKSQIGFMSSSTSFSGNDNDDILDRVCQEDLRKFGIIPELIGRFPIITHTNPLSEEDLVRILKEPSNSIIKQYRKMLFIDGVNLSFDDDALLLIAKVANSTDTGARGLRSIIEHVLTDIMYDYGGNAEDTDVNITADYVEKSLCKKYNVDEIKKKAA